MIFGKDMSTLRKLMFLKGATGAPLAEYEASGNPLTFQTNVAKPLRKLLLSWIPTQSGSGDPSPDNVRAISGFTGVNVQRTGKNLFDVSNATILNGYLGGTTGNYSFTESASSKTFVIPCKGNTHYTITRKNAESRFSVGTTKELRTSGEFSVVDFRNYNQTGNSTKEVHITTSESVNYMYVWYYRSASDSDYDATIEEMMVELGDTPSAYAPYNGNTYSVTFPALGKNLCSVAEAEFTTYKVFQFAYTIPKGTYKFSCVAVSSDTDASTCQVGLYSTTKGQAVSSITTFARNTRTGVTLTASEDFDAICCYASDNYLHSVGKTATFSDIQIEAGSSMTAYEPYTNTVYGGSLNLTTGVLTVEYASDTFVWGDGINYADLTNVTRKMFVLSHNVINTTTKNGKYCDKAKFLNDFASDQVHFYTSVSGSTSTVRIFLPIGTADTETIQVVYELAEPVTYQLTPTQITTLLNDNVIWSDTNGSNSAVYLKKG